MYKKPRPIANGARLAVWAPSSPAPQLFPRRFQRGLKALRTAGYKPYALPSCSATPGVSTMEPAALAEELHDALRDPGCSGVIGAVGGWTLLRVLEHIDFPLIGKTECPIVGYSDLTSLVNLVPQRSGTIAYYGPMVVSEWGEQGGLWEYTERAFHRVAGEEEWREAVVPSSPAWSDEMLWWDRDDDRPRAPRQGGEQKRCLRAGAGDGVLWGGSILSLSLLLGTPYWPAPGRALIFLEANAMAPDELLVRLTQLRLAGVFDDAVGLVMSKIGNPRPTASGFQNYDAVIREAVPEGIPVAAGYDLGHTDPMATLPVGGRARLHCPDEEDGSPVLTLLRDEEPRS